ncbi:beta-xylanase [Plakobranchus ocellatus]|uniref:Beta-xylanase n=1 Tax=Plakobranchus ocellatus TaxID=259542 RepID=A0AAV4ALP0_9GAST|nr:beta-xylanase [Plakobranchus ocellatus]
MAAFGEGARELLRNPGFEQGISNWRHDGFTMQADSTQVHSGVSSVKCTGRSKAYQGPSQEVYVTPGGRYAFQGYIRLIDSLDAHLYERAMVKIRFTWKDDGSVTYFTVTVRPYLSSSDGWVPIGSDFAVPNRGKTG